MTTHPTQPVELRDADGRRIFPAYWQLKNQQVGNQFGI
jgi:hypothetical protein